MKTYIALFRGINVGGNNKLPMKELRNHLEDLGFKYVKSYIQSGNVVFQNLLENKSEITEILQGVIKSQFGFDPKILVLETNDLKKALTANPFPEGETDPKSLHLFFMWEIPASPALDKLENLRNESEKYSLKDRVFYLYAPEGIGRSKLASAVGKNLGVASTARNWRTANKIMEMAREITENV